MPMPSDDESDRVTKIQILQLR